VRGPHSTIGFPATRWVSGLRKVKRQRFRSISSGNTVVSIQVRDFFARHGRPGTEQLREGRSKGGRHGWWELGAADGYMLRCDWIRAADEEQLNFSEIAPASERARRAPP
jgi:hypothetical protein